MHNTIFRRIENWAAFAAVCFLVLFSVLEIVARTFFKTGVPGSSDYVQHLVIWITFLGGMITSREDRHLSLSISIEHFSPRLKSFIRTLNAFISTTIAFALAGSSLSFILLAFSPEKTVGIIPVRVATIILPLGYCIMGVRFFLDKKLSNRGRLFSALGILAGFLFSLGSLLNLVMFLKPQYPPLCDTLMGLYYRAASVVVWPAFIILVASVFLGLPLFIALGGIAYVLLAASGASLEVIPNEAYTMLTGNSIAAIPLFTIAGFVLSESKAGERLVGLFRNLFGFLPGGLAVVSVFVCAFFTTFTGASGVTILALGGLLYFILTDKHAYEEHYATGLLTASGSIGLLFPPSLPVILYGVVAGVSIKDMFLGGIIPGIIMVVALSLSGVYSAVKFDIPRSPFSVKATIGALRSSAWEVFLPVFILILYFTGITTLVETGAVAVLYIVVVEVFIHQDKRLKDLPDIVLKSIPIIGGVLVILAVARGLSYYIIDMELPMRLTEWVRSVISSRFLFLLLLNIVLLITGCLMDIYSAIMIVAPLVIPVASIFDIHPVHLGIIFLSNLELGFLTPPVGMNLFLASYRFEKPLAKIYRDVLPFFLILFGMVLIITYVPWFSTAFLAG